MMDNNKKVIIVGGGLVGALNAIFLARRCFQVEVYEGRADIRKEEFVRGRSINLALSRRGRDALEMVGLEGMITRTGIPMYARMIHDLDGTRRPIPYGKGNQHILSVDRRKLNEELLTAAENEPTIQLFFGHRLVGGDLDKCELVFRREDNTDTTVNGSLVVGCDGAYSTVRTMLMKNTRFDFQQEYIPHGYMELSIPAKDGQFNMETNFLHIWPRNEFMMIALPNTEDQSFVLTLFMPFDIFDSVQNEEQLMELFQNNFPDSIPLIGKQNLINDYLGSKPLPLVSVKCAPYHYKDRVVIMGDAAHAMVPFYGQGMNCGFEDCIVFDQLMEKHNNNIAECLKEYTEVRNPDAKAIVDLAKYNYLEMRAHVNSTSFLLRKKIDNFLNWLMPNIWVPLYTTVSFSRIRYHHCIENKKWQDQVLARVFRLASLTAVAGLSLVAVRYARQHDLFQHEWVTRVWDALDYTTRP